MFAQARISGVLSSLARKTSDRLTVAEIVGALQDRAFALLVVLLGLPNCLPMPPPIPFVCGLLLALVAAQIAAGWSSPWLPRSLLGRSIPKETVDRAVARALPLLQRIERVSRPRMTFLEGPVALRVIGFLLIAFALGLLVAAPVIGQIPLGVAVCLVGLGLVERDGIVVCAGLLVGSIGLAIGFGFIWAVVTGLDHVF